MFCPKCGKENNDESNYCFDCGFNLHSESKESEPKNYPTPEGKIFWGWAALIIMLLLGRVHNQYAIAFEIATLIISIYLMNSKNQTGKVNGIILIIVWGVWEMIGLMSRLSMANN